MKTHLAYLTTPAPGVFILNIQTAGNGETHQFEITKAHLANIIIDGASFALRESLERKPQ
jgi:hypothetical protein